MARPACPPEGPAVLIVLAMTAVALGRQSERRGVLFLVTCVTRGLRVRACQLETSLFVMVKAPKGPTIGIMALLARGSEPALMMAIGVARAAGSRCSLELLR